MLGREICERDPAAADARSRRLRAEFDSGKGIKVRQDLLPPIINLLAEEDSRREPRLGEGQPFPQPWVTTITGRRRLDDVLGTGFRLLCAEGFTLVGEEQRASALGITVAKMIENNQISGACGASFRDAMEF